MEYSVISARSEYLEILIDIFRSFSSFTNTIMMTMSHYSFNDISKSFI